MRRDDARPTSAWWLALALVIAGVVLAGPALVHSSGLWLGASSQMELRLALAALQFPALVALAMIMERATRRVLR